MSIGKPAGSHKLHSHDVSLMICGDSLYNHIATGLTVPTLVGEDFVYTMQRFLSLKRLVPDTVLQPLPAFLVDRDVL